MQSRSLQALARKHGFRLGENLREPLARAIKVRGNQTVQIVDATAGLGRDAFLLASLGVHVTLLERVEEVHDQLASTLASLAETPQMQPIVGRMTLIQADAIQHLAELAPLIVFVDPMHPERKKAALVKKNMRTLRSVVGPDADSGALIAAALNAASQRVVVKWPRIGDLPEGIEKPSRQVVGKTVRYDVFER